MRICFLSVIVYAFFMPLFSACNGNGTIAEVAAVDFNLCFALDGSSSISPSSFRSQESVVRRVVMAISTYNKRVGLAAVQYGSSVTSISPFTVDRNAFLSDLRDSEQVKSKGTFIAAGLNYCISEICQRPARKNHIILLGDGNSNVGIDPGERATFFFEFGGEVIAVGVGNSQNITALMKIAGNNPRRVFSINANSPESDVSAELSDLIFS